MQLLEHLPGPVRDAAVAASLRAGTVKDRELLTEYRRLHNPYAAVGDTSTPDERAADHVIERDVEIREASPLQPEADADHQNRLQAVANDLGVDLAHDLPSPAPVQTATVRDRKNAPRVGDRIQWEVNGQLQFNEPAKVRFVSDDGKFVMVEGSNTGIPIEQTTLHSSARRPASFVEGINAAEGHTRNPRSSADGYGNFIDSTWLSVAPHVADTKGMSREQILGLRHDKEIAGRATQFYADQNARHLLAHGIEDSPGNRSLAHFLGPDGAEKVLKADPSTPVESILPREVIHANREVLAGKSASEVVAWAHRRIGAAVDAPVARADAVPDFDYGDVPPYELTAFKPDEVSTNAELMQYKSGGNTEGETGKLRDVEQWNPIVSSEIMVWQPREGGNIVVDGHQRTGLAKRLYADDPSIRLPAIVLREADGITAAQARVLGALRNINLGTGSLEDNARVLRDAPEAADMLRGAENRREIEGLARLNYEAFGAVLNNVVDPRIAAQIGIHAGQSPEAHMAMVGCFRASTIRLKPHRLCGRLWLTGSVRPTNTS
jgi:hypothetical protein